MIKLIPLGHRFFRGDLVGWLVICVMIKDDYMIYEMYTDSMITEIVWRRFFFAFARAQLLRDDLEKLDKFFVYFLWDDLRVIAGLDNGRVGLGVIYQSHFNVQVHMISGLCQLLLLHRNHGGSSGLNDGGDTELQFFHQ